MLEKHICTYSKSKLIIPHCIIMYSIEYPGEKRPIILFLQYVKKVIKESARHLLYWKNKRSYNSLVNENVAHLRPIMRNRDKEFFYGYYDKNPERNGKILFNEMDSNHVNIILKSLEDGVESIIGNSIAYNWQMGARPIWITDDIVSYNDFDGKKYISKWYSLSKQQIIRMIPIPTMDIVKDKYILSPDFQRLRSIDPCYAYQNLPVLDDKTLFDYSKDGVWLYDLEQKSIKLLISISEIINCKKETAHSDGYHGLNHIMVAPDGNAFIFIHRCRCGCKRYDRLMLYDFKRSELFCLMDGKLQSHFCWIDNNTVFGYGENDDKVGFYEIDIRSKRPILNDVITKAHPKDGHPTSYGDWIVIDSYPNFSRLQSLVAYNHKTKEIKEIGEFYHDMKHAVYTRCDLHPRFNFTGNIIYFDSLYNGKRELCSLEINL